MMVDAIQDMFFVRREAWKENTVPSVALVHQWKSFYSTSIQAIQILASVITRQSPRHLVDKLTQVEK